MIETKTENRDKGYRGNASQFFVAGELCRRGYAAVVTMGNCPNTDILCSNVAGTKFVHIQVKTFRPNKDKTCTVGMKAEKYYGSNFFWVLGGIPEPHQTEPPRYYIIPNEVMAKNVSEGYKQWVETPGAKGQQRSKENTIRAVSIPPRKNLNGWDISEFENRWDLIEAKLN